MHGGDFLIAIEKKFCSVEFKDTFAMNKSFFFMFLKRKQV